MPGVQCAFQNVLFVYLVISKIKPIYIVENIEIRRRAIESLGDAVHLLTVAAGRCNSAVQ